MRSCTTGVRVQRQAIWLILAAVLVALLLSEGVWAARNYYKVMGVDKEADERTIKRAYRVSPSFGSSLYVERHYDADTRLGS